jgi:hypothetical protein
LSGRPRKRFQSDIKMYVKVRICEDEDCLGAERCIQGNPQRKKPLARPGGRREGNIKMNVKSVGKAWIGLIGHRIRTSGGLL